MDNIITNLSTLTTIPKETLNKLYDNMSWCICDSVYQNILRYENLTEMDIGIGTLYILRDGDDVKYKFKPSVKLETAIKDTIINKNNPLQIKLETSLINKINHTYKDII